MKIKLMIALALASTSTFAAQLDAKFLRALNVVEASGKHGNIVGDNGKALGGYQIHKIYWQDAVQYDKSIGGKYQDVTNKAYAEKVVTAYLNRYAKQAISSNDYETLARIHNGGPKGAKKTATTGYWQKVKKVLDN
jgi:hypothetical protein